MALRPSLEMRQARTWDVPWNFNVGGADWGRLIFSVDPDFRPNFGDADAESAFDLRNSLDLLSQSATFGAGYWRFYSDAELSGTVFL